MGSEPVKVDWNNWTPRQEGEVRSPCPAINALANHSILPHSGRRISKQQFITALQSAYNIDAFTATLFARGAVKLSPHSSDPILKDVIDLDQVGRHGLIEHDVSLSRNDVALGSNIEFDQERWGRTLGILREGSKVNGNGVEVTTYKGAAEARFARVLESRELHRRVGKRWDYGAKEAFLSYGETALYLSVLGKGGEVPLEWLRIFFEEERVPYKEGWRPPSPVSQGTLLQQQLHMLYQYGHNIQEAQIVGIGTFWALTSAMLNFVRNPIGTVKSLVGGANETKFKGK